MDLVSTAYRPKARIIYNKLLKATKNLPDTIVNLDEFIDIKGMKAQGNQMTKLKVKEILLDHTIEGVDPWPETAKESVPKKEVDEIEDNNDNDDDESSTTVEWDITENDDDPDQPKLF